MILLTVDRPLPIPIDLGNRLPPVVEVAIAAMLLRSSGESTRSEWGSAE